MARYIQHFGFRPPFRIVLDGTFCQAALETRTNIRERIPAYLGLPVAAVTTKCVMDELGAMGDDFRGAKLVAKRCEIKKCGHHGMTLGADECIASFIGPKNRNNYLVATQDPDLKAKLRKVPGVPLISLNHGQLVLEKPSVETLEFIKNRNATKIFSGNTTGTKKNKASSTVATGQADQGSESSRGSKGNKFNRKRKAKGPNPLAVRKKKKTNSAN